MITADRFWSKAITGYGGECWHFESVDGMGYGQFYLRKEGRKSVNVHAHRFAWELINGPVPEGMHVLHRCDNPACIRVDHLFLGTHAENMHDARRKRKFSQNGKGQPRGYHGRFTQLAAILAFFAFLSACARSDFYYPSNGKDVVIDNAGRPHYPQNRAVVLNGSDSLGATRVRITANSIEFANQGGIDNSTSTAAGYRTVRYGVGAAVTAATVGIVASQAASAYGANQAAASASNVAASRAAAATATAKGATTVRLAEIAAAKEAAAAQAAAQAAAAAKALPAAGSVIPAQIPATVVPVP